MLIKWKYGIQMSILNWPLSLNTIISETCFRAVRLRVPVREISDDGIMFGKVLNRQEHL